MPTLREFVSNARWSVDVLRNELRDGSGDGFAVLCKDFDPLVMYGEPRLVWPRGGPKGKRAIEQGVRKVPLTPERRLVIRDDKLAIEEAD